MLSKNIIDTLKMGDMIAVEPRTSSCRHVHVARVDRVFPNQGQFEVILFEVPSTQRFGPWQKRTWAVWLDDRNLPRKGIVVAEEVLCHVKLLEQALDQESLERLAVLGVQTGAQPRRDKALPARTHE
jgi:hypothetical protein